MNNLKIIAISMLAGGILGAAGAGVERAFKDEPDMEFLYAGLIGMGAGLVLSATSILVKNLYQACAMRSESIGASSSDIESSDGDEHARYHLKDLLDAWNNQADEESLLSDDYPTTLFYGAALAAHAQSSHTTFSKEQTL